MTVYDFDLKFALPPGQDPASLTDALFEAGCDDATIGVGKAGALALAFSREALGGAGEAVESAIADVLRAVPAAELIEVKPDLVGIADFARLVGCSRQNVRKYVLAGRPDFPLPAFTGEPSLWHLYEMAKWFDFKTGLRVGAEIHAVAEIAWVINQKIQGDRLTKVRTRAFAFG